MQMGNELNSFHADRDTSEHPVGGPDQADEPRRHFLAPWRLKADTAQPLWNDDVGCGSGPVF
jgi:hypothetical protein